VVLIKTRLAQTSFVKHALLDFIKTKLVKLVARNVLWDNSELQLSQLTECRQPLRFKRECLAPCVVLEHTLQPSICQRAVLAQRVSIKMRREFQSARIVLSVSIKI
jgi:hypothetical protein